MHDIQFLVAQGEKP